MSWGAARDSRQGRAGEPALAPFASPAGGPLLEETALVEQVRGGDAGAYEQLVRRYQEIALRTAFVITGSSADAEDAAQEAFVKAYYALPRFRPTAPFRPWLLRIVANEARNRRKAAGRREHLVLRLTAGHDAARGTISPEEAALTGERRDTLLRAINRLRDDDRLVLACRYFLDLTEAETAAALDCAQGTVKSRLSRALGRLRSVLTAAEMEGVGPPATGGRAADG